MEDTLPYTLVGYISLPLSVTAADSSEGSLTRLLRLCPGLSIAHRKIVTAPGFSVTPDIPCMIHEGTLCDPRRML
jgi:hypothetical protein